MTLRYLCGCVPVSETPASGLRKAKPSNAIVS
jgi:hypothetical protein